MDWMLEAIEQARNGIAAGQTPFGAVVVRDGDIVAAGHNEVWLRTDPTAHAEMVTIQRAAATLDTIDLRGCVLYSTCEPCPMCAAAIHWSRLDAVVYGASIADARAAGFRELEVPCADLYRMGGSAVRVESGAERDACVALFAAWEKSPEARRY